MSQIRSKNTRLEKSLEAVLKKTGLQYKKHYAVAGKPDFAFPELKIAVFADSNFWHGYNWGQAKANIKTNRGFWIQKIERNIERDKEVNEMLRSAGWEVIRFWEREILDEPDKCLAAVQESLRKRGG
jgi:DNA mismatch endonuclease (patch repair protein)